MPPTVTFIRPQLTREVLNERLHNLKLVMEEIFNCECNVYFENESNLNIVDEK